MKKRKIGNLTVSEIGMGCMGFSHGYGKVPETSYSIAAIRAAHDYGCTFFDTAETYGREQFYRGHNEEIVGRAVEGFRKDIVLATKLHISTEEYDPEGDIYNVLLRHLTASMRRLRTDYVDLYYLHRFNEAIPIEKIAESMGRLIREGKIRGWGLSQVDVSIFSKAHEITPVTAVQNLYSMVERDCEKEIFPYCIEHHIGVVPFSPLASGLLSGKVTAETKFGTDDVRKFVPQLSKGNLEGNRPIVELLEEFAKVKKATPAQISLAWMLYKYPNVVPIPGSKNKERILENLKASEVTLTKTEFARLEEALGTMEIHGHRGINESQQHSFSSHWMKK